MHPHAHDLWRSPRWALAALLACLGMLGPFSIDTYLPAFSGIAAALDATPVQMQQTLSVYLLGFALMNLFHGALSDRFGRRPVVLCGVALFTLASAGCACADSVATLVLLRGLQGMSAGAGIVVSRAVVRDMYPPADAQRVMAQVTIFFGIAPALAPIIGGYLFVAHGWRAVFWFLTAVGCVLWLLNYRLLPETLHVSQRQSLDTRNLLRGYGSMVSSARFVALCVASGVPFNGVFLYVLSAPVFLGEVLGLPPQRFFWLFLIVIVGIMGGAWLSGRLAGRIKPHHQVRHGFLIMLLVSLSNLLLNLAFPAAAWWALWPLGAFAFGWSLMVPVITLMVLDQFPQRRGMASSLQLCVVSAANGVVAGAVAPLLMHSARGLALGSVAMLAIGLAAWIWVKPRVRAAAASAQAPAAAGR